MQKRYKINEYLRLVIHDNKKYSMRQMSALIGFEVRNLYHNNSTISEKHLEKLSSLLNLDLRLEEVKLNYIKNLGKYSVSIPTKKLVINEDLAEFIGTMLGDGHLHKYGIKIAFDKRNVKYIDYVSNLFKKLTGVKIKRVIYKDTNQAYIYFYSKDFADELTTFGLVKGDKIKNNVGIPSWIKEDENYIKRCIRGLIDTDGCIYICKRERQKYVKFTNFNKRLLEEFRELTEKLGYHFAGANQQNVCLYRKNEVIRFINDIKPVRAGVGVVV